VFKPGRQSRRRGRREPADRVHRLTQRAGGEMMRRNLIGIGRRRRSRGKAEIVRSAGAQISGHCHAGRMMQGGQQRL
jgi:hypothetical protein